MKEILLRKSDELSGACRNYFECLKAHLIKEKWTTFTNREIRNQFRIAATTLRRYHNELLNTGRIQIREGKAATGFIYELVNVKEYEQLKTSIDNVLDKIVNKLEKTSEPVVSQNKNGLAKNLNTSKKEEVNHQTSKG